MDFIDVLNYQMNKISFMSKFVDKCCKFNKNDFNLVNYSLYPFLKMYENSRHSFLNIPSYGKIEGEEIIGELYNQCFNYFFTRDIPFVDYALTDKLNKLPKLKVSISNLPINREYFNAGSFDHVFFDLDFYNYLKFKGFGGGASVFENDIPECVDKTKIGGQFIISGTYSKESIYSSLTGFIKLSKYYGRVNYVGIGATDLKDNSIIEINEAESRIEDLVKESGRMALDNSKIIPFFLVSIIKSKEFNYEKLKK